MKVACRRQCPGKQSLFHSFIANFIAFLYRNLYRASQSLSHAFVAIFIAFLYRNFNYILLSQSLSLSLIVANPLEVRVGRRADPRPPCPFRCASSLAPDALIWRVNATRRGRRAGRSYARVWVRGIARAPASAPGARNTLRLIHQGDACPAAERQEVRRSEPRRWPPGSCWSRQHQPSMSMPRGGGRRGRRP